MDNPLDQTTLSTIALLETRLLRIEHLLYGPPASHPPPQHGSAVRRMGELERRFSTMLSHVRVYGELLKICTRSLFHVPLSLCCPLLTRTQTSLTPTSSTPRPRLNLHRSCP